MKHTPCLYLVQEEKERMKNLSHPDFKKALSGSQTSPQSGLTKPITPSEWVMEGTNLAYVVQEGPPSNLNRSLLHQPHHWGQRKMSPHHHTHFFQLGPKRYEICT
jgi:hypothetical protein